MIKTHRIQIPERRIVCKKRSMKPAMTESSIHPCLGHVKNGVIIIDTPMTLSEGQPVRIEPLALRVVIPTDDRLE